MRPRYAVLAVAVAAVTAFVGVSTALAETSKCIGTLAATRVDNVKVPKDATCTLTGTRVDGNIKVGSGATLIATNVRVKGNVHAKDHAQLTISGPMTKIGGSIQIVDGGGLTITGIRVKGDVQIVDNFGPPITITANRIDGNLQCKENLPEPTVAANLVKGNEEDQCEGVTT